MEEKQDILTWKSKDGISLEKFIKDTKDSWKVKGIACVIPTVYVKGHIETENSYSAVADVIAEAIVVVNMHMIRSGGGDC